MDPNSDTQDNVDTTATENTGDERQEHEGHEGGEGQPTSGEQPEGENGQEPEPPKEEPKPKNRAQERIEKLARENAELRQFKLEQESKQNKPSVSQDEPKLEAFEDYNEWQKEHRTWEREQLKKEVFEELNQKESQKTLAQRQSEFEIAMVELESEGIDGPALIKKLETLPPLPIDLYQFGLNAKETLSLAAELIGNDELWLDLSQMNPTQAAMRIGQEIGRKNTKPAAPKIPNAPKPIKPVQANAPVKRSEDSMSDSEFLANRRKQRLKG